MTVRNILYVLSAKLRFSLNGQPGDVTAIPPERNLVISGPIRTEAPDFCVSPDERRIIYGQADASTNVMLMEPVR
jgi:hypothetical protein